MVKSGLTLAALAVVVAACSEGERVSSTSQAIINGTASTDKQNYVVQIAIEKSGKMIPFCTGSLIAKNLVITARHCVGDLSADEQSVTDFSPSKLKFYFGADAGPKTVNQAPEAQGKAIFSNKKQDLIPDVALIELDQNVDHPTVAIRLESGAVKGEALDIVGYGLTEANKYPAERQQRSAVKVARVAPATSKFFKLTSGEFQFGEAACAGDSGGPALSTETGALVGIASRVSNGEERSDSVVASFCLGSSAEDIYTDLTPARAFIDEAFEAAGAEPWLEGEPSPEEKAAAEAAKRAEADKKTAAAAEGCSASQMNAHHGDPRVAASFSLLALALVIRARRKAAAAS